MPQMAPMNWMMLFVFFCLFFLIINSLNYFSHMMTPKTLTTKKKSTKINWKW